MLQILALLVLASLQLIYAIPRPMPDYDVYDYFLKGGTSQDSQDAINNAIAFATDAKNKSVQWLTWNSQYPLPTFTDLNSESGQNYQSCGAGQVMVGIKCSNKYCNTLTVYCGILSSISGSTVNIDMSAVPAVGDSAAISKFANYFNDASSPPYRTCPDGSFGNGVACSDTDCKSQSLYCGSVLQPNYPKPVLFVAPVSPLAMDVKYRMYPDYCSWENFAINDETAAVCSNNKVLSGLYAVGTRTSGLQILCCPIYQMEPQDCVYSSWTPQSLCYPTVNSCGAGMQKLSRTVLSQPEYFGASCNASLNAMRPCYLECKNNASAADPSSVPNDEFASMPSFGSSIDIFGAGSSFLLDSNNLVSNSTLNQKDLSVETSQVSNSTDDSSDNNDAETSALTDPFAENLRNNQQAQSSLQAADAFSSGLALPTLDDTKNSISNTSSASIPNQGIPSVFD